MAKKAGLGLGVLAVGGLVALIVSGLPTPEGRFKAADQEFQARQFGKAKELFDGFLASYPGDPLAGEARAKRQIALLTPAIETAGDPSAALQAAQGLLSEMGEDARHQAAQAPLAELLPKVALQLSERASSASTRRHESAAQALTEAQAALALTRRYVSPADRAKIGLPQAEVKVFQLERDLQLADARLKAMQAIKKAADSKQLAEAYAARTELLGRYPNLSSGDALQTAMKDVAEAARAQVAFEGQGKPPQATDEPSPVAAVRMLAAYTSPAKEPRDPPTNPALIAWPEQGAIYGIDPKSGAVTWRRTVGFGQRLAPVVTTDKVIAVDTVHDELVALDLASGKLAWRQAIAGIAAAPTLAGDKVWVPTREGSLISVDVESGAVKGAFKFPQALAAPPAIDSQQDGRLFILADHSNLYSVVGQSCDLVVYVGHEPGSAHLAPATIGDLVVVAVDDEVEVTTLRVFERGKTFKYVQTLKLPGHVSQPLLVHQKSLYVSLDDGRLLTFDLDGTKNEKALAAGPTLVSVGANQAVRAQLASIVGKELWVAGAGLAIYDLPLARLAPRPKERAYLDEAFVMPPLALQPGVQLARVDASGVLTVSFPLSFDDLGPAHAGRELRLGGLAALPWASDKTLYVADAAGNVHPLDAATLAPAGDAILAALSAPLGSQGQLAPPAIPAPGLAVVAGRSVLLVVDEGAKKILTAPVAGALAGPPIAAAQHAVAALEGGPIFAVDPKTAGFGAPFLPSITPGHLPEWHGPVEIAPGQFVASDGRQWYRLQLDAGPKWTKSLEAPVTEPLVGGLAAAGKLVWGISAGPGKPQQLIAVSAELQPAGAVPLEMPAVFGPVRIGSRALVATAAEKLIALGDQTTPLWEVDLPHGPLAGITAVSDGVLLAASRSGVVWAIKADSGEPIGAAIEVGQPLAGPPVIAAGRIIVAGADGSLQLLVRSAGEFK